MPEEGAGRPAIPAPSGVVARPDPTAPGAIEPPSYKKGELVATREAYGTGLAKLGAADARVVALDADVKNSTFTDRFEKVAPERFYQAFIAEQVMVGMSMGLAARGAIPFADDVCGVPDARGRLRAHGRHQRREHQVRRQPLRRLDRRGRRLADGARGPRDVPRRARTAPCSTRATP